jgi:hypothetical protein
MINSDGSITCETCRRSFTPGAYKVHVCAG